MKVKNTKLKN